MYLRDSMNEINCDCEQCLDTVHSELFESDCMWVKPVVLREAHDRQQDGWNAVAAHVLPNCFSVSVLLMQLVGMKTQRPSSLLGHLWQSYSNRTTSTTYPVLIRHSLKAALYEFCVSSMMRVKTTSSVFFCLRLFHFYASCYKFLLSLISIHT